jgi:type III secretion protein U
VAEKNHAPTHKRLRDARQRGEVVHSADVASTAVFVVVLAGVWLCGPTLLGLLRDLWEHATSARLLTRPDERFPELLLHAAHVLVAAVVGIAVLGALAGMAGSFFQVGGLMAWERLKPDVSRMNPAQGFQRIFSTRNLVNLLKMVVKTLLLAGLIFVVLRGGVETAVRLGYATPVSMMSVGARLVLVTFAWAAVIYAVMAGVDYATQHYEFIKSLRMSIDEVRREYKDMQGDPSIRARRRSEHFESVYFNLSDRVRAASAVIRAQGVAVALQYLGPDDLPRVIARGQGEFAAQIVALAAEHLVPMQTDSELASRLLDEVPIDRPIPRSLYPAVARLLRWADGGEMA